MPKTSRSQLLATLNLCAVLLCSCLPLHSQTRPASPSTSVPATSPTPGPALRPANTWNRVQDVKFFSKTLQREMAYRVVLPKDYFTTEVRYPVLYLVHGYTGHYRSFEAHSNLTRDLDRYQLIVVSIEAENSWLINSSTNPKEKWEDYFLHDVISDAQDRFRINGGDARAIAGISSGGYAAINLAFKYPGLFFFAGSLSGSLMPRAIRNTTNSRASLKSLVPPAVKPTLKTTRSRRRKKPSRSAPLLSLWPVVRTTIRLSATINLLTCCASATSPMR
jgi:enterochelin esterase-like enzyme